MTFWVDWRDLVQIAGSGEVADASDHENPTGITVSKQKGLLWRRWEVIKNFNKCLNLGRWISGTFGYHLTAYLRLAKESYSL
jgi:hypothetical protein